MCPGALTLWSVISSFLILQWIRFFAKIYSSSQSTTGNVFNFRRFLCQFIMLIPSNSLLKKENDGFKNANSFLFVMLVSAPKNRKPFFFQFRVLAWFRSIGCIRFYSCVRAKFNVCGNEFEWFRKADNHEIRLIYFVGCSYLWRLTAQLICKL